MVIAPPCPGNCDDAMENWMLRRRATTAGTALAAGCAVTLAASTGLSAPCADLDLPNPIYGSGGSAVTATLKAVGTALSGLDEPITILYADPGACPGYQQYLNNAITGTFKYWNAEGTQLTCDPPLDGQPADFAHMGNDHDFCIGLDLPEDYPDNYTTTLAQVQTLNFIVHGSSSQKSISAEALYYLYGLGAEASGIAPWTDPTHIILRSTGSFVHQFAAVSVFDDPAVVYFDHPTNGGSGIAVDTQQDGINRLLAIGETSAESPLFYVSSSAADANRATVKTLAYQHFGQTCGYWPDSSESALDKLNVRTGKYHFWTPGHFYARVDDDGEYVNPLAAQLLGWFSGELEPPEGVNVTELVIKSGDVPLCAMSVQREGVSGAIRSYAPPAPCNGFFENEATGTTEHEACEEDSDCGDDALPKCRFGFCEAY
jgi:hypothetical protein